MSKPSFLNKTKKKICLICEGFELIRTKINNIFGNSVAADKVIIFVNPCTMQVILSHFGDVSLRTQNKRKNNPEIKRLTGLSDEKKYDGCKEHRDFIFSQITKENYEEMKKNLIQLSSTVDAGNDDELRKILSQVVPTYMPNDENYAYMKKSYNKDLPRDADTM